MIIYDSAEMIDWSTRPKTNNLSVRLKQTSGMELFAAIYLTVCQAVSNIRAAAMAAWVNKTQWPDRELREKWSQWQLRIRTMKRS